MSIRLDPRRVSTLKQLAGDAGVRPGDLVREWVEERIDAVRQGVTAPAAAGDLASRLADLAARVAALESAAGIAQASGPDLGADPEASGTDVATGGSANAHEPVRHAPESAPDRVDAGPQVHAVGAATGTAEGSADSGASSQTGSAVGAEPGPDRDGKPPVRRRPQKRVAGVPSVDRVALHDEMIAVLSERGPMSAGDLAAAISERGRYAPPRSGRTLDAAMVSQRVSNPTYRSRFARNEGRIGLAEQPGTEPAE